MGTIFVVTGANGHLAGTIIRYLRTRNCQVRGLILPYEENTDVSNVRYYKGDITDKESLGPLFSHGCNDEMIVIHAAGIVSLQKKHSPEMLRVNVDGTRNVIQACLENKVKRLLYVSSVHAIPEGNRKDPIRETGHFSEDAVKGSYSRTKAIASQMVLDAGAKGLDVVIVHPSGIYGPFDTGRNHITQMIIDYMEDRLRFGIKGGYDFVDVRDVAKGCIAVAEKGRSGECYILSNRYISVPALLEFLSLETGGRKIRSVPSWLAKLILPVIRLLGRVSGSRSLITGFSLDVLRSNVRFSHSKATLELEYVPRSMEDTVRDTLRYLKTGECML
ncbi:MAG: NAD-dependent epimerase/dehydratase family protein [Spirochaetales bacterium]|nr:NAD-dependent epimerase/dehydratase family protein [Spirochaetales bacterium]